MEKANYIFQMVHTFKAHLEKEKPLGREGSFSLMGTILKGH